jgi:hypothetical protein
MIIERTLNVDDLGIVAWHVDHITLGWNNADVVVLDHDALLGSINQNSV